MDGIHDFKETYNKASNGLQKDRYFFRYHIPLSEESNPWDLLLAFVSSFIFHGVKYTAYLSFIFPFIEEYR